MANIVFVQKEMDEKLGPMILVAYLQAARLDARIVINPYKRIAEILQLQPDFIGISLCTPSTDSALDMARFLKRKLPSVKVVLGGPHPTFFPQVVLRPEVDVICVGEGEKPLRQMLQAYDGTLRSIRHVPNLWIKDGSELVKNAPCPLLTDQELSELPYCDRSVYDRYPALRRGPHKKIWVTRGCPYDCSFCFNHAYKQIYAGCGKPVRQRSVASAIEELKQLKRYGYRCVEIVADQFITSKSWVLDFCVKYAEHIRLPFACCSTAKQISHEVVGALKQAGCKFIMFGVESGVERIRREVYNKPITDADIYGAAEALHAHRLPFVTFNMIGLPEESLADIYATVAINQRIQTPYPWCSILQPYPGTQIAQRFHLPADAAQKFSYSFFQDSILPEPRQRRIVSNAQKLFLHCVQANTSYDRFVRYVENPPFHLDALYPLVFYWYYGKSLRERYGYGWGDLFKIWLDSR
jgi:anaerobic magnesium-protoporphyrin IX monomethyl ester cyclase